MSSIIKDYTYDIFISYRQKDNKYDGWVTEFVDNLKRELESMFKDEVSVYFDINPSDYLLETYDVDASLRDKLKCLVFIPIVSRTYCDPKAFAWNHEFKTFIEQAGNDKFGLKVPLPNGNVTSRVLPVRIHDLDINDLKLCESILGGVFRGVDFIYSEPGVNRPLRSSEENPHSNLNHTIYRNQINKVALAVREIIESLKSSGSPDGAKPEDAQKKESKEKKDVKADVADRKETIKQEQEVEAEPLKPVIEKGHLVAQKSRFLLPAILGLFAVFIIAAFLLYRHSRIKWAREEALPEIERLRNEMNLTAAFKLVQKAKKYLSEEPKFRELASFVTTKMTVLTDPPGADVYIREYSDLDGEWKNIGKTPIDTLEMPYYTFYRMKIEKPGYENVMAIALTDYDTLSRTLFREGTVPENMVYVEGYWDEVKDVFVKGNCGFFMDRYEVTNKQYKDFVDNGGYRKPEYWKNEFVKDGKILSRDEAIALFTDKTGRPGPSIWEAGDYPDGQDDYPVTGVSWYEAAAYAEYAGKSLPTGDHWDSGAGFHMDLIYEYFGSKLYPLSNFRGKGPESVRKSRAVTCFGAYDMAGNVREWCWNETRSGRIYCGGGWSDPTYLYTSWNQLPPFDRSPENGFRCIRYIDEAIIPETAFRLIDLGSGNRDYTEEVPVSGEVFRIYRNQFLYDSTALHAEIEERDKSAEDWIIEKITFDAAYGNERMVAYLYLPSNALPPFQTVIFFPGSYAVYEKDLKNSSNSKYFIDFVLKNGRAVMYPVYFRTYERNDGETLHGARQSHQYTELLIKWVKDFSRSIDYLETRKDIDIDKLAFAGHSWGGVLGGIIPAIEDRLAVNILIVGGFSGRAFPEADAINYVSRVRIPTLMLNGRYDYRFPEKTNLLPFFNLLGTPEQDKRLCIYETDHYVPRNELIKEVLAWCDEYLGPVRYRSQ